MQLIASKQCKTCKQYINIKLEKALNLSAFFIACLLCLTSILSSFPAFADSCSTRLLSTPEKASVKWVYDGDTLLLRDKRKIRVIGIDTPEVKHHKQKAQAYGAKAREALREKLNKYQYHILLRYGKEHQDKYGRTLAHVFLPDGTNISNWLLERGYARALAFPPNIALANCYRLSEQKAQDKSLRIWRYKNHQIKTKDSLSNTFSGYVRYQGKIIDIKKHKKSVILILEGNSKRPLRIKIKKKHLKYFKSLKINALWHKTILVSGILRNRKGTRTIYVSYPTQISIIKGKTQKTTKTTHHKPFIKWSFKE